MASTFTPAGIELIADGEQSGTWGQTTNTNWELVEELTAGLVSISLSGLSTYTLTTSDGASSEGRHAVIKFTGTPSGTCTVTVSPNDMQKIYWVVNDTDQTVVMSQGSGANVSILAGYNSAVYCDGAGAGAAVGDLFDNLQITGNLSFGDNDKAIFGAGSDLQIYHDGTTNKVVGSIDVTGTVTADGLTVDTNTLHVDATNNRVGIGTSSPAQPLHVNGAVYFGTSNSDTGNIYLWNSSNDTRCDIVNTGSAFNFNATYLTTGGYKPITFNAGGTERMRINSSGNVGIGTSSPSYALDVKASSSYNSAKFTGQASSISTYIYSDSAYWAFGDTASYGGNQWGGHATNNELYAYTNGTERMRIDSSGNLLVGTTTRFANERLNLTTDQGSAVLVLNRTDNIDGNLRDMVSFRRSTTGVGLIACSNTSTSYITSSDYRLKTDVQPMTGATERLKALNPVNFAWKVDGSRVDGFLAHEAQEVVPEAVSGTKDAVEVWEEGEELPEGVAVGDNKLDEDGNTIPEYQGIDQSKLVPLLVAAMQEQQATIEDLTSRLAALEN